MKLINSLNPLTQSLPLLEQLPANNHYQSFDGSAGTNRLPQDVCQINAQNDYEAIQCWLAEYRYKEATFKLYQKEAERLLLWCIIQRRKALSSLAREDFELYFAFLDNPQPKGLWCNERQGRHIKRGAPGWKPFKGKLGQASKATAISALASLFEYLTLARYLSFNPLSLIRKKINNFKSSQERKLTLQKKVFEPGIWNVIIDSIEELPITTPYDRNEKERIRFLIYTLYFLGLRNSELRSHHFGHFFKLQNDWWFKVTGKGNKVGIVPVNHEYLAAVQRYRSHFRLPLLPEPQEETPLLLSFKGNDGLTPRHVNNLIKKLMTFVAKKFKDRPEIAERLMRFSAHGLRHQSATNQHYAQIDKLHIKDNLRHSSDQTTNIYIHDIEKARYQDMQKLSIKLYDM